MYYIYFLILILGNLRAINDIESAKAAGIKPGQKLCHTCRITILKPEQDSCMQIDNNDQDYENPEEIANLYPDYELPKELCRENVNQRVGSLLFFPTKPVSNQYKVPFGKRKFDQVLSSSSELVASALDLSVIGLIGCTSSKMMQECCQKPSYLYMLTEPIKEKLKMANKEKIKLRTITPVSWVR